MLELPQKSQFIGAERLFNIGLLVLSPDPTTEIEFKKALPEHNIYVSRIEYPNFCDLSNLNLHEQLFDAASSLPDLDYEYVVFACTSGSINMGVDFLNTIESRFKNGTKIISPSYCILDELNEKGAKTVSLVTPYIDEVHEMVSSWISNQGFIVENTFNFSLVTDKQISEITNKQIQDLIKDFTSDVTLLSCTALPTLELINQYRNVISSNSSMIEYIRRHK